MLPRALRVERVVEPLQVVVLHEIVAPTSRKVPRRGRVSTSGGAGCQREQRVGTGPGCSKHGAARGIHRAPERQWSSAVLGVSCVMKRVPLHASPGAVGWEEWSCVPTCSTLYTRRQRSDKSIRTVCDVAGEGASGPDTPAASAPAHQNKLDGCPAQEQVQVAAAAVTAVLYFSTKKGGPPLCSKGKGGSGGQLRALHSRTQTTQASILGERAERKASSVRTPAARSILGCRWQRTKWLARGETSSIKRDDCDGSQRHAHAAVTEAWRQRAREGSATRCAALGGESKPGIGSHTETRSYAGRNVVFSHTSYVVDDAHRSRLNEALQPTNYKKVVIYILSQRLWSAQTSCEYLVVKTVPSQSLPALESPFPSLMIAALLVRAWIESR
ncbi:hypothetical protein B0H14DRAFT_2608214 [Mycena olivaceomarginata]|nr:hypothetical protein B0H14DRAFT_2608214 [Mycena olivaceomarginata]